VRGSLTLRTVNRYGGGSRRRTVSLGRATFRGVAGSRSSLRIQISRGNSAFVRRLGRVRVRVTVVLTDTAGNRATRSVTFTLRPARASR